MAITLNHVAILGYSCLFVFSAAQVHWTYKNYMDLFNNILLLVGLGALISYHWTSLKTGKSETNDEGQRKTRLVAHASLSLFLVLTLTSAASSKVQFYDYFAMIAHIFLFVAVLMKFTQLPGVGLLALYFFFATYRSARKDDMLEMLQFVGRLLMTGFFSVAFVNSIHVV